jgi:hypothetical protein
MALQMPGSRLETSSDKIIRGAVNTQHRRQAQTLSKFDHSFASATELVFS